MLTEQKLWYLNRPFVYCLTWDIIMVYDEEFYKENLQASNHTISRLPTRSSLTRSLPTFSFGRYLSPNIIWLPSKSVTNLPSFELLYVNRYGFVYNYLPEHMLDDKMHIILRSLPRDDITIVVRSY